MYKKKAAVVTPTQLAADSSEAIAQFEDMDLESLFSMVDESAVAAAESQKRKRKSDFITDGEEMQMDIGRSRWFQSIRSPAASDSEYIIKTSAQGLSKRGCRSICRRCRV